MLSRFWPAGTMSNGGFITSGLTLDERIRRLSSRLGKGQIPCTFVALQGEQPLGQASLVLHDMEARKNLSPWLGGVLVGKEYRRQGVGTALCDRVVQEAAALAVKRLYLFTYDKVAFYQRRGWSVLEQDEYAGYPVTIMDRDLSGASTPAC